MFLIYPLSLLLNWLVRLLSFKRPLLSVDVSIYVCLRVCQCLSVCLSVGVSATLMLTISETEPFMGSCPIVSL